MTNQASNSAVIVRLDRTIQYTLLSLSKPRRLRLLDARFRGHDRHWRIDV
jgi:hypothetical protein